MWLNGVDLHRIRLTPDAIGPVSRGHPWVYANGVMDPVPPPGQSVQLMDDRGRLVGFGLSDTGDIVVRVLSRQPDRISDLINRRITRACDARESLLGHQTNAYRMVNGAGDDLPGLVVDRYESIAVIRLYGQCWQPHLDDIVTSLVTLEGIDTVIRKYGVRRVDAKDGAVVLFGPRPSDELVVIEHGLKFLVRPYIGQKTGLFLDQRENRRTVAALSNVRNVVNLFSYTGGFSVHAAACGAQHVTTVDISEDAISDAKQNFKLNGLNPDAHTFVVTDAFKWRADQHPDVLICDPPALSHAKTSDSAAARAYRDLAETCSKQLNVNGLLATSSCTSRLNRTRWEQAIRDGVKRSGRWTWMCRASEPMDHPIAVNHPEGRYLKFGILRRLR